MAQQYGAAQPVVDLANKARNAVTNLFGNISESPRGKKDTAWHDEMVRKANESLAKRKPAKRVVKKRKADRPKGR